MVNVEKTLQHLGIDTSNCSKAVATTRDVFLSNYNTPKKANTFFNKVFDLEVTVDDVNVARFTAQYMVQHLCSHKFEFDDAEHDFNVAHEKAVKFRNDPKNAFHFAGGETTTEEGGVSKTTSRTKPNREPTKGERAWELYVKHVAEAKKPLTNIEFVHLLVKELSMTTAGARTYAYNCFKKGKEGAK